MNQLLTTLLYVVGVGGMFLLLIGPHEAGHFLFAKLFKVRVIEFSIGAGTKLWSVTRGGTLYALRALPILGYVRMGGMESGDFEDPNGFHAKPAWQRIVILFGGPAANFLVAMLLVTGLGLTQVNTDAGKVFNVVSGTPAAAAGMQPGDSIHAVNGKPFTKPGMIVDEENAAQGQPLTLTGVHSNGQPFTYVVTPKCDAQGHCLVGVGVPRSLVTVQTAILSGVVFPFSAVAGIVQGLWSLISGNIQGGLLGPQGLTGPIGIADIAVQSVNQGLAPYIFLVALLSVALGFTNLLPLLALDGGRIVVVVIEWLRRRPFDRASELNFHRWGLVALLGIAAVISFLDIQRIATGQFPGVR
ncbi:MAG TPA: M50 family metallopeptidase [Candidatus Dormibacteraeota bacterium]|nr:M50 family metallopeptidase [Candidatus Dormibacteraeota bacterium]